LRAVIAASRAARLDTSRASSCMQPSLQSCVFLQFHRVQRGHMYGMSFLASGM